MEVGDGKPGGENRQQGATLLVHIQGGQIAQMAWFIGPKMLACLAGIEMSTCCKTRTLLPIGGSIAAIPLCVDMEPMHAGRQAGKLWGDQQAVTVWDEQHLAKVLVIVQEMNGYPKRCLPGSPPRQERREQRPKKDKDEAPPSSVHEYSPRHVGGHVMQQGVLHYG